MDDILELETPIDENHDDNQDDQQQDDQQQNDDQQQQQDGEKTPVTSLFQSDGKKLDPQVSATLANIKKENPDLGKLLTGAIYKYAELQREFPGGLTEARELRDKVEEFGGLSSIEEKIQAATEFDDLGKQYMSADPAFVDDLVESSPEAFAALAPLVFQKFGEVNPEGFSAYMGRVVLGDMQANGLPLMLERVYDLIPADNAKLKEAFDKINAYLGGFQAMAQKPLPKAGERKNTPGKPDELSKREEVLRAKEWQTERDAVQKQIVNSEYTRALAGRKPNEEERAQIQELFRVRASNLAEKHFPGWQEKSQRYITNNDKAGYLRYMKTIYTRVMPEAVASAVKSTMKGTKAAPAGGKKPAAPGAKPQAPVASGFKLVAKEPGSEAINWKLTTSDMVKRNQAVLWDGSKVTWR